LGINGDGCTARAAEQGLNKGEPYLGQVVADAFEHHRLVASPVPIRTRHHATNRTATTVTSQIAGTENVLGAHR